MILLNPFSPDEIYGPPSPTSCPITPWLQDAMDKMDDAEKLSSPLILDLGATGISLVSVTGPNAVKPYANDNIALQKQVA